MGIAVCINGALAINHSSEPRFIPLSPERAAKGMLVRRKNHQLNPAAALFVKMISEGNEKNKSGR